MSVMSDPYVVEFRVHNPSTGETELVMMPGRNRLHCTAKAANRFSGCVVTATELDLVDNQDGLVD